MPLVRFPMIRPNRSMSGSERPQMKRPRYPMSDDIKKALDVHALWEAYSARPPYQQNDYVG